MIFLEDQLNKIIHDHLSVIVVDRQGTIVHASMMTERMFKRTVVGDLIGQPVHSLLPRSKRDHHRDVLWEKFWEDPHIRLMGEGTVLQGEKRNGEIFPIEVMLIPWKVPGSGEPAVIAIITDITERLLKIDSIREKVAEHASQHEPKPTPSDK